MLTAKQRRILKAVRTAKRHRERLNNRKNGMCVVLPGAGEVYQGTEIRYNNCSVGLINPLQQVDRSYWSGDSVKELERRAEMENLAAYKYLTSTKDLCSYRQELESGRTWIAPDDCSDLLTPEFFISPHLFWVAVGAISIGVSLVIILL
jgi:hypothetical protein